MTFLASDIELLVEAKQFDKSGYKMKKIRNHDALYLYRNTEMG